MTHCRYGSDNQKGADWHPTRAFHMLRGEAIAWLYGLILLDTLHMVEGALAARSAADLSAQYAKVLGDLSPMPHPKKCHPYRCEKRPICHTDFKPHFPRNMTLTELVVGSHRWTYDAGETPDPFPFPLVPHAAQRSTASGRCTTATATPSRSSAAPRRRASCT